MTSIFAPAPAKTGAFHRRSRALSLGLAASAALALSAGAASAGTLVAGSNPLSGTTTALEPQLAGTVVQDVDTAVSFGINGGTFAATVQSRVVLADDGTYDFYWRIFDTSFTPPDTPLTNLPPPGLIGSFRIGDFGIPTAGLNGNYATDGLGDQGPDTAFVFTGSLAQFVNFNFSSGLAGGKESYFMFLDTNAHSYNHNAEFDLTNVGQTEISDSFSTFGVGGVPEPAAWTMMIAGFGLAGAALRGSRRGVALG